MRVVDVGRIPYAECVERQRAILERVAANEEDDTLLLVQHDPVITLGANFHPENLLVSKEQLCGLGIEIHRSERGGDVTYHGPGQLVAYPIFNLVNHGKDLHRWLRDLEEVAIRTIRNFGLDGYRFPPHTGVWVGQAKICAIGVKVRRWTSMHGLALNCDNDLSPFNLIVPCGIQGYAVTSLSEQLNEPVSVAEAKPAMVTAFQGLFGASCRT
jgi:lipoyl(octanoyl) transferase